MKVKDADLLKFLPTIALFGGLEDPSLKRIIAMLQPHELIPGVQVCTQGDVGRALFLVHTGEALVYRETESGRKVRLIRMGPGEFFGEMTLIDPQKRSASVVVEKPSLLFSLSAKDMFRLYQDDVAAYVLVLQNICRELARRLRTTNKRLAQLVEETDSGDTTQIGRQAVKRK